MQTRILVLLLGTATGALAATSCKSIDCGEGTVERDNACVPADQTIGTATCGPFTELQGTQCVPMFKPTVCDPATTDPDLDTSTGVTTCVGHGGGGCGAPLACPTPAAGKQTICGQIYNFETNAELTAATPTGAQCTSTTTTGPCALVIHAYDAIDFATDPANSPPLTTGAVYIDDCGRYRVPDIAVPSGPFVGLGFDDANSANLGPAGITNAVGVATPKLASMATKDFEGFVVPKSTTDAWTASGGPAVSTGFAVSVFRAHKTGLDNQAHVTVTRNGGTIPSNDSYFTSTQTTRTTIDTAASETGMNGTALIINASVAENLIYSGQSSLPAECQWEKHAAASLPNIVFIQIYRPINNIGQTCNL